MENEINALWDYTKNLESMLIQSVKHNIKFKKNVKNKLKCLCMALVENGIKPSEIVKCINLPSNLKSSTIQYDFSEDSDVEEERKNLKQQEGNKEKGVKKDSDTESDYEMDEVVKQRGEEELILGGEDFNLETLNKLKKFFEKNHQLLKKDDVGQNSDIKKENNFNSAQNSTHSNFLHKKRKGPETTNPID